MLFSAEILLNAVALSVKGYKFMRLLMDLPCLSCRLLPVEHIAAGVGEHRIVDRSPFGAVECRQNHRPYRVEAEEPSVHPDGRDPSWAGRFHKRRQGCCRSLEDAGPAVVAAQA